MPYRTFIAALYVCLSLSVGCRAEDPQPAVPNQWDGVYVAMVSCSYGNQMKNCSLGGEHPEYGSNIIIIKNNEITSEKHYFFPIFYNDNSFSKLEIDKNGHFEQTNHFGTAHIDIKDNLLWLSSDIGNFWSKTIYARKSS